MHGDKRYCEQCNDGNTAEHYFQTWLLELCFHKRTVLFFAALSPSATVNPRVGSDMGYLKLTVTVAFLPVNDSFAAFCIKMSSKKLCTLTNFSGNDAVCHA